MCRYTCINICKHVALYSFIQVDLYVYTCIKMHCLPIKRLNGVDFTINGTVHGLHSFISCMRYSVITTVCTVISRSTECF